MMDIYFKGFRVLTVPFIYMMNKLLFFRFIIISFTRRTTANTTAAASTIHCPASGVPTLLNGNYVCLYNIFVLFYNLFYIFFFVIIESVYGRDVSGRVCQSAKRVRACERGEVKASQCIKRTKQILLRDAPQTIIYILYVYVYICFSFFVFFFSYNCTTRN